jgi:hypothetical protein
MVDGNPLTLSNGIDDQTTNPITISLDVTLSSNSSINASYSGAAGQSGSIIIGAAGNTPNTFDLNGHNLILSTTAAANTITVNSTLSGAGNITLNGQGTTKFTSNTSNFVGDTTVNGGIISLTAMNSLGDANNALSVGTGAALQLGSCTDTNGTSYPYATSITGPTATPSAIAKISFGQSCSGISADEVYGAHTGNGLSYALTGSLTLGSDVTVGGPATSGHLAGDLSGSFNLNVMTNSGISLIVEGSTNATTTPNGTYTTPNVTQTLSDIVPANSILIQNNATVSLDGTRGDTTVFGLMNGSGTVSGILDVQTSGTVAPGHSPGCVTSTSLNLHGTFQAQIGGAIACSEYDQLIVTAGPIDLTNGQLDVSLLSNFAPIGGTQFTIVKNDGSLPITGAFAGLVEGATITVGSTVFQISYLGGDGNDVVLSVVAKAPNTGAKQPQSPFVGIIFGLLAALALIYLSLGTRKPNSVRK